MCRWIGALTAVLLTTAAVQAGVNVDVRQYDDAVLVYVHDLDLLRAQTKALTAEIGLQDGRKPVQVDLDAPYQTPAILVRKTAGTTCKSVIVIIRDGDQVLLQKELPAGVVVAPAIGVPLSTATAYIQPGKQMKAAPKIVQPDVQRLPMLTPAAGGRRLALDKVAVKVESDINYPLVSARNNCAVSRQTAHPNDPTRRSIYVPLKSQLYDQKTGEPGGVAHYLCEVALQRDWMKGADDEVINLAPDQVKAHTTDKMWPPGGKRQTPITGFSSGGLGQLVGGMAVDDDGNLYYANTVPSEVARFNVAKAAWEAPPIDIVRFMNEFLPKKEIMPYGGKGNRWDNGGYLLVLRDRLYYMPIRFADYRNSVYLNGIFSFPLKDWYDAAKFRAGAKMAACCWPGTPVSLYDRWPEPGEAALKLGRYFTAGSALYMDHYSGSKGGPWQIDLAPDGSAKSIKVIDTNTFAKAAREANAARGAPSGASGLIVWEDYGVLNTSRGQLSQALTGARDVKLIGSVTIYYDALGVMRAEPQRNGAILANLSGPSLAPCYMAVPIPDQPGHILGVGEYGYYLADLDITKAATGAVPKRYIKLALGKVESNLPVRVGLGPYGHVWWNDGGRRYLIMTGYTGIAELLYSVDGKPLDRYDSKLLHFRDKSLDGANPGSVKRSRYPVHGLDQRIYLTGTHTADRGGDAYSSGLMAFHLNDPDRVVLRLSYMNRGCHTYMTRARVVYQPDGRAWQQFVLVGAGATPGYILKMNGQDVPENQEPKLYLYDVEQGGEPRDRFGFTLPAVEGKSGVSGQVFSRDQRYLVTIQQGAILTFDMATLRYVDGRKLPGPAWEFSRPDYCFQVSPDDRRFVCLGSADGAVATFYEVDIAPDGRIALAPHVTLTAANAKDFADVKGGVIAFVPDPSGDGSADLCIGPDRRGGGTNVWVIPDFIAQRARQAG